MFDKIMNNIEFILKTGKYSSKDARSFYCSGCPYKLECPRRARGPAII